jgi:division protein CdvB (Snf7/Vps24/ESCRT-III family)
VAIDPIAKAVQPNADQSAKLDALKNAEADAGTTLAASCAAATPTTAVGRLDAVQTRLQAMIKAADAVGGPLNDFYASLNDEQKAQFNALGQNAQAAKAAGAPNLAQICGPQNAVPVIAVDQIDSAVQPDAKQRQSLEALRDAAGKADDAVLASCPKAAPLTPTGRLDAVKARLQAMANAVDMVKPPLQDFYASLSDAQKSRLDSLTTPPSTAEPQRVQAQP